MAFGRRAAPRRGTPADLLVVGLGNPGDRYAGSRHNAGAEAVTVLAERHGERLRRSRDAAALVAELRLGDRRLALAVPTTYMNESGRAVAPLVRRFGIDDLGSLVIVHDELDLEPGRIQVKRGGGLAGHNGLRSVSDHLRSRDYLRVRIGVGRPIGGGVDYVLSRPSGADAELIRDSIAFAADAVETILHEGVDAAMARFNRR